MTDKIVATTLATPPAAPPVVTPYSDQVTWLLGAVGSAIATLLWLRRKTSRDSTEIAKDRAEQNLVQTLTLERDKAMADAREAWARRTADAEQIAGLKSENEYLKRDVERLGKQVNDLTLRLDMVTSALSTIKPDFRLPPANPA
jgi:hypothetical protein